MGRKKSKAIEVPLYRHGIIWWLVFGWYWRPFVFIFWFWFNIIFNTEIRFVKERK